MAPELFALRRLAGGYRRVLLLAVPAALAGCQDAGDSLGPAADAVVQPVWQIWIMPSAGGSATRITHTSATEQMAAFSH